MDEDSRPLPSPPPTPLVEGLEVVLFKDNGNSYLQVASRQGKASYFLSFGTCVDGKPQIGIRFDKIIKAADPLKDTLPLQCTSEIPERNIPTLLNHPFVNFRMSPDGKGIGIADIRDLRTGGKVHLEFDLYETSLTLAIIPMEEEEDDDEEDDDEAEPLWTLVLGWDEDYSPTT